MQPASKLNMFMIVRLTVSDHGFERGRLYPKGFLNKVGIRVFGFAI